MICAGRLSLICWVRVQTLPLSLRWQDMRTSKQRRAMTNAPKKQSGKPPSYCTCLIKQNDNEKTTAELLAMTWQERAKYLATLLEAERNQVNIELFRTVGR